MRCALISAAMLGVMHVTVPVAAAPGARPPAEGADGGQGTALVRGGASTFLAAPEARQSPLVAVGEGGEGGRGREWRRRYRDAERYRYGDRYRYGEPYRYRAEPPPHGWGPPRGGYYVPAPPPYGYGWQPEPRPFPPRPPSAGVWIDPGF